MVHNPGHAGAVSHLHRLLDRYAEQHGCHARGQLPLTLDDENEPEPDIAIVLGDPQAYWHGHPGPRHVQLVVEVSHSTLEYDRTTKLQLYASASIPLYWIVNLIDLQVESFWMPVSGNASYAQRSAHGRGDTISLALPGGKVQLTFEDLLPAHVRGA
jgi:Uma2 family endonuclease